MAKSDKSIHNICIASIKRSTMKPYDFKWTRFYESDSDFKDNYPEIKLHLADNELLICSTVIDIANFSILTTQRLITQEEGKEHSGSLPGVMGLHYGDLKGYKNDPITFGLVQLRDGQELKYFIETGRASMVMIHGIRTWLRTQHMTHDQVDKVANIWNGKNGSQSNTFHS